MPAPGPVRLTARGRRVVAVLAAIAAAAAAGLLSLALAGGAAAASHGPAKEGWPAARKIVVEPGQTLWSIAAGAEPRADTRAVIDQIIAANSLRGDAIEPGQVLWVHYGEIASYADIARRSGVPVSAAELDAFVDEQRRSAAVVGLDPAAVPASMTELDDYCAQVRPQLRATPEARQALRMSFTPHVPRELTPLRLVVPPLNTLAFASLPRWARRLYGTPASPLTDAAATVALRAAHQSTALMPRQVLQLPLALVVRRRNAMAAASPRPAA
jgi:hypothetical protein